MDFQLEKEMVAPVKSWFQKRQEMIKQEFRLPWGYCDLVGCSFDNRNVSERLRLGQKRAIGPHPRVQLLWEIPDAETNNSISKKELFSIYEGIRPSDDLEQDLKYLDERNFLTRNEKGYYQKLNGWFPLQSEIVAIELKLKNVRKAMRQAQSHFSYANFSYVALPRSLAEKIARSNRQKEFSNRGLGLLGVSPDWCQTMIKPTKKSPTDDVLKAYCGERFWRDYTPSKSN